MLSTRKTNNDTPSCSDNVQTPICPCQLPKSPCRFHYLQLITYTVPQKDLVALKHAVNQIAQRTPVVTTAGQAVLIDEQDVLLEAGVEVRLKTQFTNDWVVVAVDVGVDSVHALENLASKRRERLGEGYA